MQINIKTSAANQSIVSNLTQKLPAGAKENIIALTTHRAKNIKSIFYLTLLIETFISLLFVKLMVLIRMMS